MPTIADWQLIETAPRDGTPLLLICQGEVRYGWWFQADQEALDGAPDDISGWYLCSVLNEEAERCQCPGGQPSAWASLPKPPRASKRKIRRRIPAHGVA